MTDPANFLMLFAYNAWADDVLFAAMRDLPDEVPYRPSGTLFKSMVGTLNHNYQVDLIWRAHLLGQPHGFTSRRDVLHARFDDIVAAQADMNAWFTGWCATQSAASLDEVVTFRFVSGEPGRMRRSEMLFHLVNHKTYHRGWIAQMFFEAGFVPPESDLPIFLAQDPARLAA